MNNVIIKPVSGLLGTLRFIRVNQRMYKGHPYAVPDFTPDLVDTLTPSRNSASEFCEWQLFIAYSPDGKAVGRIVAAINHRANETWGEKVVRFGWIEFEDDIDISRALLDTVEQWGRERGMTTIEGPLGFTDMDPEGMLIEGFDQLSTMATIYNPPYYPQHMERMGWQKATDWVERKVTVPAGTEDPHSAKYMRVAKISAERYGYHVRKFSSIKEIKSGGYHLQFFDVINKAYANLFGFSQMTPGQMEAYADQYLGYMDLRMVTFVMDTDDKVIAVAASMPSLSRALQRTNGRLLPTGWWHLLKVIKYGGHDEYVDLLLVAVLPEYQNKGVNAFLFADLIPIISGMGYKWAETHPQLEDNDKSQSQWQHLDCVIHKRRRCWKKPL